jgi:hypothetical protein
MLPTVMHASRPSTRRLRRRGAAMLVVMMLLLIVTATASFAIHATSVELRSTGHARQRMQTRYLAEAALVSTMTMLEQSGPEPLGIALERSTSGAVVRRLAPEEPPMAASTGNHRVEITNFSGSAGVVGAPIDTTVGRESLGVGMGYTPTFVVDVTDVYSFTGAIAGQRADGLGTLQYLVATYTARGRTLPPSDTYSPTTASLAATLRRGTHESAMNARGIGISGPTRRR